MSQPTERERDPRPKKRRKRSCDRYGVEHNGVITTFGKALAALAYHEATPGSILLWGGTGSWSRLIKISPEVLRRAD